MIVGRSAYIIIGKGGVKVVGLRLALPISTL